MSIAKQLSDRQDAGVSKRLEFLLQEHGFQTVAYFVFETEVRFILVTSRHEGYDLLLQVPPDMRFEAKRDNVCCIELLRADDKWLKQAGPQAQIDLKYVSRNMKQLLDGIEENVQVNHRVQRLKLAWYDPIRYLLVTETNTHQPPLRFAIRDMSRCQDWMASRPIIWFSAVINDLFSRSFSLWDESLLTGKWLRNTLWLDQKHLWSVMNQNWRQILGNRLLNPNETHPFTKDFETYETDIHDIQTQLLKLRKSKQQHLDKQQMGSELLLHLQRDLTSALLYWHDALDDWHSFFPAFQHQWEATQRFTLLTKQGDKGKESGKLTTWASSKLHGIMDWLSNGDDNGQDSNSYERALPAAVEDSDSSFAPIIPIMTQQKRPKNRRIEQLNLEASDSEDSPKYSDAEQEEDAPPRPPLPPTRSREIPRKSNDVAISTSRFDREVAELTQKGE